jgi:hypothetical protein
LRTDDIPAFDEKMIEEFGEVRHARREASAASRSATL